MNKNLKRRQFLKRSLQFGGVTGTLGIGSLITWHEFFDGPVANPCMIQALPEYLINHDLMKRALESLDISELWDCHFHLIGNGLQPSVDEQPSGILLNPKMTSWLSPVQRLQYNFYLNAACIDAPESADKSFMENVFKLLANAPEGTRFMLVAFEQYHHNDGQVAPDLSNFYVPNRYAARMAALHPQLEWIASIHPYREDAVEELDWCVAHGARAIKWLPPAMNIDPASPQCAPFYQRLVDHGLPLLTHAGDEKAVHSEELQRLANPLLLRRPLEMGVKVIVAHCASLGENEDLESNSKSSVSNFQLFSRLMEASQYQANLTGDISAINLINREISEIQQLLKNQHWHDRLLYASDYPLPGVMPIISAKNLASHRLLDPIVVPFLNEVRQYNVWLFDFLMKRYLNVDSVYFSDAVFSTRRHFVDN